MLLVALTKLSETDQQGGTSSRSEGDSTELAAVRPTITEHSVSRAGYVSRHGTAGWSWHFA